MKSPCCLCVYPSVFVPLCVSPKIFYIFEVYEITLLSVCFPSDNVSISCTVRVKAKKSRLLVLRRTSRFKA
jgi:hypothetical protein